MLTRCLGLRFRRLHVSDIKVADGFTNWELRKLLRLVYEMSHPVPCESHRGAGERIHQVRVGE